MSPLLLKVDNVRYDVEKNYRMLIGFTDLKNDKTNWNKTPGYTEAETTAFAEILRPTSTEAGSLTQPQVKFVDVWRDLHPDAEHYTYFSYRFECRTKGIGWRLDMCECYTQ